MKLQNPVTREQFEQAMQRYLAAGLREEALNKAITEEVNEIAEKYADELHALSRDRNAAYCVAQAYCAANKEALFTRRRSLGTPHGIAGFRLGTPRLRTMKGYNWKQVLQALKEKLPAYVRVNEEPARDMLLADRHNENVAPLLVEIGVQVVQEDLFYIEPAKAA